MNCRHDPLMAGQTPRFMTRCKAPSSAAFRTLRRSGGAFPSMRCGRVADHPVFPVRSRSEDYVSGSPEVPGDEEAPRQGAHR